MEVKVKLEGGHVTIVKMCFYLKDPGSRRTQLNGLDDTFVDVALCHFGGWAAWKDNLIIFNHIFLFVIFHTKLKICLRSAHCPRNHVSIFTLLFLFLILFLLIKTPKTKKNSK